MNGTSPTASAGGLAAATGVVALAVGIVVSGSSAPPAATPPPAPTAAFEPSKMTLVATRDGLWPLDGSWSEEVPVRLRASDAEAIRAKAATAHTTVASGEGKRLAVTLKDVKVSGDDVTALVRADDIDDAGEYSGILSLDPLQEKAASLRRRPRLSKSPSRPATIGCCPSSF